MIIWTRFLATVRFDSDRHLPSLFAFDLMYFEPRFLHGGRGQSPSHHFVIFLPTIRRKPIASKGIDFVLNRESRGTAFCSLGLAFSDRFGVFLRSFAVKVFFDGHSRGIITVWWQRLCFLNRFE